MPTKKEVRNLTWQLYRFRETIRCIQEAIGMGRIIPRGSGRAAAHFRMRRRLLSRIEALVATIERLSSENSALLAENKELREYAFELRDKSK